MTDEPIALVMAGGLGSRMARTDPNRPKPLVEVLGVSLLELTLHQVMRAKFTDVRIAVRHGASTIVESVRKNPRLRGRRFVFMVEREPLGTIGALRDLRDENRSVVVVNGDLVSGIDLRHMFEYHRSVAADLTIATHAEHHHLRLGEVIVGEHHRVRSYLEKPVKEYRISSGTYVFEPRVIHVFEQRDWTQIPDLVNQSIERGLDVVEYFHQRPWIDVNDAVDLASAREMLRNDPVAFGVDPRLFERAEGAT